MRPGGEKIRQLEAEQHALDEELPRFAENVERQRAYFTRIIGEDPAADEKNAARDLFLYCVEQYSNPSVFPDEEAITLWRARRRPADALPPPAGLRS